MKKKMLILVVDMLNDFVTGALKCDRGLKIVSKTYFSTPYNKYILFNFPSFNSFSKIFGIISILCPPIILQKILNYVHDK